MKEFCRCPISVIISIPLDYLEVGIKGGAQGRCPFCSDFCHFCSRKNSTFWRILCKFDVFGQLRWHHCEVKRGNSRSISLVPTVDFCSGVREIRTQGRGLPETQIEIEGKSEMSERKSKVGIKGGGS